MPTSPEVTNEAVEKARQHSCVLEANNAKEWMCVAYKEETTEAEKERVEQTFPERIERDDSRGRSDLQEIGLSLQSGGDCEVYWLAPAYMS